MVATFRYIEEMRHLRSRSNSSRGFRDGALRDAPFCSPGCRIGIVCVFIRKFFETVAPAASALGVRKKNFARLWENVKKKFTGAKFETDTAQKERPFPRRLTCRSSRSVRILPFLNVLKVRSKKCLF